MTYPVSWQGKVDYIKSALDYATLGRAFINFLFPKKTGIHKYDDRENH